MITTVIFDLDGTLTNTLADIASAMDRALRLHGLPEYPVDAYRLMVGNGARRLAERAVKDRTDLLEPVLADYQAWYETHNMEATRPYPGIERMLAELSRDGLSLAVLSNKPNPDTVRVVTGYFPATEWALVRGKLPGVPTKPHPACTEALLDALCASPANCLFVGDSSVDVETAHNAHMPCVGVSWGFRGKQELKDSGADFIIDAPEELPALIRDMNRGVIRG